MTLAPGTTIGRYQILAPLGRGGMATVYKAFQPSLEREVALKVLRPGYAQDAEFLERFEREAKSIARLRHPHIVQVFDFEAIEGQYALAMEFLEGGTLKDRLAALAQQGRGLEARESARIIGEVADALSYAHELGIVHRDIKPSNVMLTRRDRAVVTDFGIARILGATSHTQTGVGIGTPEYMAPEQGQGAKVDHHADIYSLGAMAYELLTGRVPFTADTPLAIVLAHLKDPLPLPSAINPTIGPATERALLRVLAKDPQQRFSSATDFAESLRAGLAEDERGGTVSTMVVRGVTSGAAARIATAPAAAAPARPLALTITLPAALRQRPLLSAGLAIALLLALGGAAAVSGLFGRAAPSPGQLAPAAAQPAAATPAATVAQPAAAPAAGLPIPGKGKLLWEAKLDGSSADITGVYGGSGDSGIAVRPTRGAIEVVVLPTGTGSGGATFAAPALTAYVGELDVAAAPGADVHFNWVFRFAPGGQRYYAVQVETLDKGVRLYYTDKTSPVPNQPLTAGIPVPALHSGNTVRLALVVEPTRYTLFVDGKQIAQASDDRIQAAGQPPGFWALPGKEGTLKILGARVYELAAAAAQPASPATAGPSAPKFAIPAKGALIYDVPLDVTGSGFRGAGKPPVQTQAEIRYQQGAVEFVMPGPSSGVFIGPNVVGALKAGPDAAQLPDPDRYIVEYELAVTPGSDVNFAYVLRQYASDSDLWKRYGSYALGIGSFDENVHAFQAPPSGSTDAVRGDVAGMQTGRTFVVAVVVEHPKYTLYVDQKQIGQFIVPADLGTTRPEVQAQGNKGSIKILGLRYYELPK